MTQALFLITFIFGLIISLSSMNGAVATLIAGVLVFIIVSASSRVIEDEKERDFITKVFLGGLLFRAGLGFLIYTFKLEVSFGPDAYTYDIWGNILSKCWSGIGACSEIKGENWGMFYFVGAIYWLVGANPLVVQFISAVLGAVTAVMVYFLTQEIFLNKRVARYSALLVAFFPAMIIWSAQLLKDGFMVFLLIIIMFAVIKLQKKFDYWKVLILILGLSGILALRFYIFYMVGIAAVGAILLGLTTTVSSLISRAVVIGIVMIGLLFLGVQQTSQEQIDKFSLENIQKTRQAAADETLSNSSVESDADVSTTAGAISTLPIGVITILMAPFPWQMGNLTQILTLPEMLVWWAMFPFMYLGIKYTIKNRLRESIAILIFTLALLLAYSIYQGNIGTIYRQRTQIQIFLIIFAAVGYVIHQETKENQQMKKKLMLKQKYSLK